jgi:hypothetical protein
MAVEGVGLRIASSMKREIFLIAGLIWGLVLIGLGLGFGFLKVQI